MARTAIRGRRIWPLDETWTAAVVGCGLMGGSLALALHRRWPRATTLVFDRKPTRERHQSAGDGIEWHDIDAFAHVLRERTPKLVVLATPLDVIVALLPEVARVCRAVPAGQRPLVLDLGSVKQTIVAAAQRHRCPHFVGGHPMAGSERSGFAHARAELFDDRPFVLCPSSHASANDLRRATRFIRGLGATPIVLPPAVHDRSVALVSHVPHLAAWTLMATAHDMVDRLPPRPADLPLALAAGAWRDATRVAEADPVNWAAILRHNRTAVLAALRQWMRNLSRMERALTRDDPAALCDARIGVNAKLLAHRRRRLTRRLPPVQPEADKRKQ